MGTRPSPTPPEPNAEKVAELGAFLADVHHEVGNHLAAIRFASQLLPEEARQLAESADRAAMQAGSLLALTRPLLQLDAFEIEVLRVETLFDLISREWVAQGQSAPRIEVEAGLPALRVCVEVLQTTLTALGLRGTAARPTLLRAERDREAVLVQIRVDADLSVSTRERLLLMEFSERLLEPAGIRVESRDAVGFSADFWCPVEHDG